MAGAALMIGKDSNRKAQPLLVGNDGGLGSNSGEYGTSGTLTGDFGLLLAHADSVLSVTSSTITGTLTSVNMPQGFYWRGRFSSVTITSGEITAYDSIA